MSKIKDKIKELLVRRLKLKMSPQDIKNNAELFNQEELGLDSIDALELVVGLQKEFGVVITDKALAERVLVSVDTIAEFIEEKRSN
tara:strand:- start:381 stop:638 length:258 start_codon:yes stop_codon:yes gene_type:complete